MPVNEKVKLINKVKIAQDTYKYTIQSEQMSKLARPGQFLEIRVSDSIVPFLRRPISIYQIDKEEKTLEFIFQIRGEGTKILAQKNVGEEIEILGPLGYGTFKIDNYESAAIIGGGIGIFPLYELVKNLYNTTKNVKTYLGFRNKDFVVLEEEFKKVSHELCITTDDGSYGIKGFAINELEKDIINNKPNIIFACGPLPMLKAVKDLSIKYDIHCQISLEERMGCGLGACLGCAIKYVENNEETYKHVCREGPVFWADKVDI